MKKWRLLWKYREIYNNCIKNKLDLFLKTIVDYLKFYLFFKCCQTDLIILLIVNQTWSFMVVRLCHLDDGNCSFIGWLQDQEVQNLVYGPLLPSFSGGWFWFLLLELALSCLLISLASFPLMIRCSDSSSSFNIPCQRLYFLVNKQFSTLMRSFWIPWQHNSVLFFMHLKDKNIFVIHFQVLLPI